MLPNRRISLSLPSLKGYSGLVGYHPQLLLFIPHPSLLLPSVSDPNTHYRHKTVIKSRPQYRSVPSAHQSYMPTLFRSTTVRGRLTRVSQTR